MKMTELKELTDGLSLPKQDANAIIKLIDLKTDNDMEKILSRMDSMKYEMEGKMDTMKWMLGIVGGVVTILLTIIALKK